MALGSLLCTMTRWLSTFSEAGRQRTRSHLADGGQFRFQLVPLKQESIQIGMGGHGVT